MEMYVFGENKSIYLMLYNVNKELLRIAEDI